MGKQDLRHVVFRKYMANLQSRKVPNHNSIAATLRYPSTVDRNIDRKRSAQSLQRALHFPVRRTPDSHLSTMISGEQFFAVRCKLDSANRDFVRDKRYCRCSQCFGLPNTQFGPPRRRVQPGGSRACRKVFSIWRKPCGYMRRSCGQTITSLFLLKVPKFDIAGSRHRG